MAMLPGLLTWTMASTSQSDLGEKRTMARMQSSTTRVNAAQSFSRIPGHLQSTQRTRKTQLFSLRYASLLLQWRLICSIMPQHGPAALAVVQ